MSLWGSRTRDRKRRKLLIHHSFDSVKDNVKRRTVKLKKQKIERLASCRQQILRLQE